MEQNIVLSLYRKYRPQKFEEVYGQEGMVEVLKEAIKQNKISHAYLFSGCRGIGKTTMARIFAKDIGCKSTDLIEIDAASHTSIEDIKMLAENIYTMPMHSPYTVYILDEVHMLSISAFNAFLKILEEPPSHCIFLLATTEEEKLPETVLSRCQIIKLKTPGNDTIKKLLVKVASKEGFKLNKEEASSIAMAASGSFRDALGLLQQVLTLSKEKEIKEETVSAIVGIPSGELVNQFLSALTSGDTSFGIECVKKAFDSGADMVFFSRVVVDKMRSALLYKMTNEDKHIEEYEENDKDFLIKLSEKEKLNTDLLQKTIEATIQTATSYVPQLPLEMLMINNKND